MKNLLVTGDGYRYLRIGAEEIQPIAEQEQLDAFGGC